MSINKSNKCSLSAFRLKDAMENETTSLLESPSTDDSFRMVAFAKFRAVRLALT